MHAPPCPNHIAAVNSRKNLLIVASALLASASAGFAEIRLYFTTDRSYRQNPREVAFQTGSFGIRAWDGNWFYGCGAAAPNSIPNFFFPSIACPLGATGYLVAGDGDGDGIRDDFSYWEITNLIPGVAFEPNRPDLCSLYSAPPSKLPRPLGAFTDLTDTIFYNLVDTTQPIRMYKLPDYRFDLTFESRTAMDQQVVTGLYQFSFPRLGTPEVSALLPVTYYPIPEGYKRTAGIRQGFRFTKLNNKALAYDAAGFVGVDPRVPNIFSWEGNTADLVFPSADSLYVSISDLAATPVGNPDRPIHPTNNTVYPGFFVPIASKDSRVLQATPMVTEVVIPPGFVTPPIATPAREAIFRVALERNAASSTVCYDISSRTYELPIRFVNTYEGWAAIAFRPGIPASMRAPGANPDGDAYTNYVEWRNNRLGVTPIFPNPMVRDVIPPPVLTFVQARPTRSTDSAGTSHWETSQPKTESAYPPITYEYEFSADMQNWSVVTADNPDWLVIDSETEIKIQSKHEMLSGAGFLRVKSTQAPEPPPSSLE